MTPLFFTLENNLRLMIIPDTLAHVDGHPILSYTYSIFLDKAQGSPLQALSKENALHLEKNNDPNYYGYITFEKPGQLFSYTADGQRELSRTQVEEVIEHLSHIRDNPSLWKSTDNL